jgi:hypothetical protein
MAQELTVLMPDALMARGLKRMPPTPHLDWTRRFAIPAA